MVANNKIDNNSNDPEDDSILYELLEYFVRKQDPELVVITLFVCFFIKMFINRTINTRRCQLSTAASFDADRVPSLLSSLFQKCKNDAAILPTTGTIKNALRYLNNRYSLPESISQQISLTLPWKFAVGDNGRLLAILQENVIEIRKSKDEYSSVVGKASGRSFIFSYIAAATNGK